MPKSMTFGSPESSNMTLAGLMSRCTTPWPCAWCSASATRITSSRAPFHSSGLSARRDLGQGSAPKVLEGDVEGVRAGIAAHVVDDDDVRMGEAPRGAGLGEEALLEARRLLGAHREGELHRLERHRPAQLGVGGAPDHSHHPAAQLLFDDVAGDAAGGLHGRRRDHDDTGVRLDRRAGRFDHRGMGSNRQSRLGLGVPRPARPRRPCPRGRVAEPLPSKAEAGPDTERGVRPRPRAVGAWPGRRWPWPWPPMAWVRKRSKAAWRSCRPKTCAPSRPTWNRSRPRAACRTTSGSCSGSSWPSPSWPRCSDPNSPPRAAASPRRPSSWPWRADRLGRAAWPGPPVRTPRALRRAWCWRGRRSSSRTTNAGPGASPPSSTHSAIP